MRLFRERPAAADGLDRRSLERLLGAGGFVSVDRPEPFGRWEGGKVVDWWWVTDQRAAFTLGNSLVSVTRPRRTTGTPHLLRLEQCDQVVLVNAGHPHGEGVVAARARTVTLSREDGAGGDATLGDRPAEPRLADLIGAAVRLDVDGTAVESPIARQHAAQPFTSRTGTLAEAAVLAHGAVAGLDDGTLAWLEGPVTVEAADGGGVRLRGAHDRVVVDGPGPRSGSCGEEARSCRRIGADGSGAVVADGEPFVGVWRPGTLVLAAGR